MPQKVVINFDSVNATQWRVVSNNDFSVKVRADGGTLACMLVGDEIEFLPSDSDFSGTLSLCYTGSTNTTPWLYRGMFPVLSGRALLPNTTYTVKSTNPENISGDDGPGADIELITPNSFGTHGATTLKGKLYGTGPNVPPQPDTARVNPHNPVTGDTD